MQDYKEAVATFKTFLDAAIKPVHKLYEEHEVYPFARGIKEYYNLLKELHFTRSDEELVNLFHSTETKLSEQRDLFAMADEFVEQNLTDYDKIKIFTEQNRSNFENLGEVLEVQATELVEFIKTDAQPRDSFPGMKKSYKEINEALKKQLKERKQLVTKLYTTVLEEIDTEKASLKIEEASLTADKDYWLTKIDKEKSLSQLEIYELKASDLRKDSFKILADYVARKQADKEGREYQRSTPISIAAEMKPTEIKTPEELDEYLKALRAKLMVKLNKNQKLYLS